MDNKTIAERLKELEKYAPKTQQKMLTDDQAARLKSLDSYYNNVYYPSKLNEGYTWLKKASEFANKVSNDYKSREGVYQSPEALSAYEEGIRAEKNALMAEYEGLKQYITALNADSLAKDNADKKISNTDILLMGGNPNAFKSAESNDNYADDGKYIGAPKTDIDQILAATNNVEKALEYEKQYWSQWADEDAYRKSPSYYENQYAFEKDPEWDMYRQTGEGLDNPTMKDYVTSNSSLKIQNPVTYARDEANKEFFYLHTEGNDEYLYGTNSLFYEMTEDEVNRYNYLRGKYGLDVANKYSEALMPYLADRRAKTVSDRGGFVVDILNAGAYGVATGVQGLVNAAYAIVGSEAPQIDPYGYNSQLMQYDKESAGNVGGFFIDAAHTIGNMAPGMAVSAATGMPVLGSITLGTSAGGNAYANARQQGYGHWESLAYGVVNGVLEGSLQHWLGGISSFGGKIASKTPQATFKGISKATARFALQTGAKLVKKMGLEAFEEGLQAVLDPIVRGGILGEDINIDIEEVAYSALMGAFSAGLLEGGGTIVSATKANSIGKKAFENGSWQGALDYALVLDPNSKPYQLAKGLQDGTIKADGNNVGNLYTALAEYMHESKKHVKKGNMTTDQYVAGQNALKQIYEVRTAAEAKQNASTDIPANIMSASLYQEIKGLGLDEKTATKYSNAITNLKNGTEISAKITNELISGNSLVRDIVSRELGIDTTNKTPSELRNAVKSYVDTVKSQPNVETAEQTAPKTEKEVQYEQAKAATAEISKALGEKGQAVYNEFSQDMQTGDSLLYFNNAVFDFYNQGVEQSLKKNPAKKYTDIKGYEGIAPIIKQRAFEAGKLDNKTKAEAVKKTEEKVKSDIKEIKARQKELKHVEFDVKDLSPSAGKWTVDEGVDVDNLNNKQNAAFNYLKAVSEVSGINVHIMSGINENGELTTENGFYDGDTNTVYVSINAGAQSITDIANTAVLKTASHEITHYIAATDTDAYQELRDYVVETFKKEHGEDGLARRISDIQDIYLDQINKELTYEKAIEEMVANACETMLRNSKVFSQLVRQNMTVAERLKDGLDKFIAKMDKNREAAFEGIDETSLEARLLTSNAETLKKAQELWDNALKAAIKKNQESGVKSEGKMSEVREYDYSKSFAEQIDDYKAGKFPKRDTLIVSGTPKVFQEIGLNPLPMTYAQGHLKDALANKDGDHLGETLLKKLPEALQNPIAIIDSTSKPGRLVAIVEIQNHPRNVLAAVEVDGYGNMHGLKIDSNAIATAHSRDNAISRLLKNALISELHGNGGIYYWDKKSAIAGLNAFGVQFPGAQQLGNGHIRSITHPLSKVNKQIYTVTKTRQFINWFGDWTQGTRNASKVINADGTPKIMYHGTAQSFTAFDRKKARPGFYGRGFYFTDSESHAKQYGNAMPVYLNIRNPLSPGQSKVNANQIRAFLEAVAASEDYSIENYGEYSTIESILKGITSRDAFDVIQDINATAIGDFGEAMRLFNEVNGTKYDGVITPTETIVYEPTQIKSASQGTEMDNIGTFDSTNPDIRYSLRLPDNAEALAKKHFGRAPRWAETGYLTTDGTPLDFSGRHWSPDHKDDRMFINSRQVDHMDIQEVFPDAEGYREAQFAFVARGNIRIVPETAGINLAVKPTEKQASMLKGYFTAMKASRDVDTLLVDIDDANGKTVKTLEYPKSTSPTRIINDINAYFDGKEVQSVSDVARFHTMYNLRYDKLETGIYKDVDGNEIAVIGERIVGRRTKDIKRVLDAEIKKHIGQTYEIGDRGELVYIDSAGASEYAGSNYTNKLPNKKFVTKTNATPMIKNVLKVAKFIDTDIDHKPTQRNHGARSKNGFNYYTTKFAVPMLDDNQNIAGYNVYNARIIAAVGHDKKLRLHDLDEIIADRDRPVIKQSGIHRISANEDNISQPSDVVNKESSLRYDETEFNARRELSTALLTVAQTEAERKSLEDYQKLVKSLNVQEELLGKMKNRLAQMDKTKDPQRYVELQKEVRAKENWINKIDSRLINLEATAPIKAILERREARLKEQFARSSTTRAKYRNNIKKNIRSLDKKLRTNSGQKHILKEFQPVIASLLDTFTNNTSVFKKDQLATLKALYAQFKPAPDMIAEGGKHGNDVANKYDDVEYAKDLQAYTEKYVPMIAETIEEIAPIIENMRLIDLDAETLAALDQVISNINHIIVGAEEIFVNNKAEKLRDISEKSMTDMDDSGFKPSTLDDNAVKAFLEYKNTLPVYVMERLGNTVMEYLWKPLESASYEMVREQVADTEFLQGKMKEYNAKSWQGKTFRIKLESGKEIALTQEQVMYIYAAAKREATHKGIGGKKINHLGKGGIIIPKIVKETIIDEETGKPEKIWGLIPKKIKNLKDKVGTPLTDADIAKINKLLSKEQKQYVDDMVKYLSTIIADRGNKVSRQLYGIDIFNEEYYIPLMSSSDYLNVSFMGQTEKLIKNAGMTKSLTQGANNPIVVDDFTTVVAQHLQQMERYDTLAVPLDNFNRWLNYQSYDEDAKGNRVKNGDGVRMKMSKVYGDEMQRYINQLLKDANAVSIKASNEGTLNWFISRFRKNAVLMSLSVAIQQPSAMYRALAYISPKYLLFQTGWTHYHENLEEMLKYSGAAFVKEHGSFDPAVSNNAIDDMLFVTPEGWQKVWQLFNLKDATYRDQVLSALPKAMDRITWVRIWNAVKNETKANNPGMDVNSEEFLEKVGERFDYVINRTQVYDSVLSKSELMRSKSAAVKSLTSFGAEPTVAYNMLLKANTDMAMAISKGEGKKSAGKFLARTASAFVIASFANALLKSLVTAARRDRPDDEDDKSYLEWYAHQLVNNFISDASPLGLLPGVRELQTALEGYDLTNSQLDMLSTMFDAVTTAINENKPIDKKLEKIASAIGMAFGIPVENIIRDTGALRNVFVDIINGWSTDWEGIKDAAQQGGADATILDVIPEPQTTGDKLFNALMSDDANAYKTAYAIAQEEFNQGKHKDYKNVESYVRAELKQHLAKSNAIIPVYEAYKVSDIKAYNEAIKVLTDKGFTQNDVVWAKNTYEENLNKQNAAPKDEAVENEPYEEEATSLDKNLLVNAIANGKELEVIADWQSKYKKGSQEYKDNAAKIKRYVTQELKPQYQDAHLSGDDATKRAIANRLIALKKYGINYDADTLSDWRKKAKEDRA